MNTRQQFLTHVELRFTEFFQAETKILGETNVTGGDINQCHLLETTRGRYFMKVNASIFGLDFFEKEARGLVMLADAGVIKVPRPLFDGKFHQQVYLVMEHLQKGDAANDCWVRFGEAMAALHKHSRPAFGLDYPNYIGRLHQKNDPHKLWSDFYAQERILPLARKAFDKRMLSAEEYEMAEALCGKLRQLIPEEAPALLHGDLWSGNFMSIEGGQMAIFDPSVYYGHREMDLGMALLFGGFDPTFFEAYEAAFPLVDGWRQRTDLFQLYPRLVHLLLFGGQYREEVCRTLKKYL